MQRENPFYSLLILAVVLYFTPAVAKAQNQSQQSSAPDLLESVNLSIALVLAGEGQSVEKQGTGLVVQSSGVLLTAYHVIKGAHSVQVQLKNGETFDRVELIAVDERRDVAALRISGTSLPTLATASMADVHAGQEVYVISHASGLTWTASSGIISGVRMADEVPGAGRGYRLVQFTAPVSPGSSGGVVVDTRGRAIGIVVGTVSGGQNLNFAVPLESVIGLAHKSGGTAFASGAALQHTARQETAPPLPLTHPPARTAEVFPAEKPEIQPVRPDAPELSTPLQSRDPTQLLRTFRTIYIISRTVWLKLDLMQQALQRRPEPAAWGMAIVADPRVADVRLSVDRVLFTWTWTYELVHQNTGIVLASGKLGATAGGAAADKIAEAVVKRISEARGTPASAAPPNAAPPNASPPKKQ